MYSFASAVFFRNSRLYCKKLVIHLWFKVLSIAGHYSHLSGSVRIPRRKNWSSFGYPRIDPIFYFFIRPEVLVSQAMCHWSKQVIVRESNVWRIRCTLHLYHTLIIVIMKHVINCPWKSFLYYADKVILKFVNLLTLQLAVSDYVNVIAGCL